MPQMSVEQYGVMPVWKANRLSAEAMADYQTAMNRRNYRLRVAKANRPARRPKTWAQRTSPKHRQNRNYWPRRYWYRNKNAFQNWYGARTGDRYEDEAYQSQLDTERRWKNWKIRQARRYVAAVDSLYPGGKVPKFYYGTPTWEQRRADAAAGRNSYWVSAPDRWNYPRAPWQHRRYGY